MNKRNLMIIVIILVYSLLFVNCNNSNCLKNVDQWINEAPQALEEFLLVKQEIEKNQDFFNNFAIKGTIYLTEKDTIEYFKYHLPKLKKWFSGNRGYILIDTIQTSFCFKKCSSLNNQTANGYIFSDNSIETFKPQVNLVDSLYLKDGWFAYVITCVHCDD